jgi:predicted  nucleic acid-binding Zn-ribbon protein
MLQILEDVRDLEKRRTQLEQDLETTKKNLEQANKDLEAKEKALQAVSEYCFLFGKKWYQPHAGMIRERNEAV